MADQDAPKSAYEIAMARLQKKDKEEGVVDRPITEAQRAAIAEAKKIGEARMAERDERGALVEVRQAGLGDMDHERGKVNVQA